MWMFLQILGLNDMQEHMKGLCCIIYPRDVSMSLFGEIKSSRCAWGVFLSFQRIFFREISGDDSAWKFPCNYPAVFDK